MSLTSPISAGKGLHSVRITQCALIREAAAARHQGAPAWRFGARSLRIRSTTSSLVLRSSTALSAAESQYLWTGTDDFVDLNDRVDAEPLPLPPISQPKRVVLVRHGESTWNAEARIQGSTDFSELTPKGVDQACTSQQMLDSDRFDVMFRSPLRRCTQTSNIIWGDRAAPVVDLPVLREIDLYSFQGLKKEEGQARFGDEYRKWKVDYTNFEIDGHFPVRELWYRGSLGWQEIFGDPKGELPAFTSALVVAHNAVNQAMIASAIGLPPVYFRRLLQSNAAITVLDFEPGPGKDDPPRVTVDRLNSSPAPPVLPAGRAPPARVILVRHADTFSTEDGILLGSTEEGISTLGSVQAQKLAEMLLDAEVHTVLSSPSDRAQQTVERMTDILALESGEPPELRTVQGLAPMALGEWEGMRAKDVAGSPLPAGGESLPELWKRSRAAWEDEVLPAAGKGEGETVVVVGHAAGLAAMLCHALGLSEDCVSLFRLSNAGATVLEFPQGVEGQAVARCINYTAYLGRWKVPATYGEGEEAVCGIDGCF